MNKYCANLKDVLELFEDDLSEADIVSSKLLSSISSAIVKSRVDMGKTQKEFAEHMHVSQSMVSKWESADYNFSVKALAEIASKLELDISLKLYKPKIVEINPDLNIKNIYSTMPEDFSVMQSNPIKDTFEKRKTLSYFEDYTEEQNNIIMISDGWKEKKCYSM